MTIYNFEEYDNPNLYDKENNHYVPELSFLLKRVSEVKGPIIELACGTGRVAIPLAEKDHQVIGVDIHKGMLAEAAKKSAHHDVSIDWIEQDCTRLQLDVKSEFIYCVGNSFQHFLTNEDQDGFLSSVNKHLQRNGIFVFGTRFPSTEELLQPSTEEYWRSYTDRDTSQIVDLFTISTYDALQQIQHYTTIRKYKNSGGELVDENRTNISLRYTFPKEMERLLRFHGFDIAEVYRDWNETPLTNDSYEMIYVCRKM